MASHFIRSRGTCKGKRDGSYRGSKGALGHWMAIKDGKIQQYQVITPTADLKLLVNNATKQSIGLDYPCQGLLMHVLSVMF